MSCDEFALWSVSDDPAQLELARRHAADCPQCAARLAGFTELLLETERWRAAGPEPRAELEERIRRIAAASGVVPAPASASRPRGVRSITSGGARWRRAAPWLALAAALLLSVGIVTRMDFLPHRTSSGALLVEQALQEASAAEVVHARAIARLEDAAAPMLARAGDPALPARDAALLLSYRDRLRYLDRTLAQVDEFLRHNPYHAKARAMLLAGYVEKTEVLREVLALRAESGGHS